MIYTGWAFISIGTARLFVAVDEGVCDRNWILTHLAVYNRPMQSTCPLCKESKPATLSLSINRVGGKAKVAYLVW